MDESFLFAETTNKFLLLPSSFEIGSNLNDDVHCVNLSAVSDAALWLSKKLKQHNDNFDKTFCFYRAVFSKLDLQLAETTDAALFSVVSRLLRVLVLFTLIWCFNFY